MWFGGLPIAVTLLWQFAQPLAIPEWFITIALAKLDVLLWQSWQDASVRICPAGLPGAIRALWQAAHSIEACV
ncbi:hypothetical protein B1812_20765 [Methylocystis bryophila]|uniref:Uncharacterized protein n=1 Tax=Methylocystis bryophila TaxID=655015 RepID=A0A1W6MZW2_9HYPH|nr:hypothetical protein B1812_20765 [Methylocystis bryophila]